ncbi:MAG TPA: MraY family glycosyltransferase [Thermoanaerobaculia bacterium]|nr:MraY family glycosyltransferase [Thermoanaerobaculia bacterium]
MTKLLISAGLSAGIAALVSNFVVPLVTEFAVALRAIDRPGGRKTHQEGVARLGGVGVFLGLLFGTGSVAVLEWVDWGSPLPRQDLVALLLGLGMVFLVGLVDDVTGVSAWKKLLVQVIAAGLLVNLGLRWQFELLGLPGGGALELGPWSGPLTVLWIVGVTNAINLIDGLDGLASGVVAIIAGSFLIFALLLDSPFTVVLMAGIVGACLGFLPHNREPARIFLGDAGSLSLGFLLAAFSVQTSLKAPAAVAILVPLLALGVPVIDTLLVMLVRFLERPKGPMFRRFLRVFHADRNHLHHLLESVVTTRRGVVRWIYALVLASSVMALTVVLTKSTTLGIVLVVVEIVAVALVRELGMARRAGVMSRRRRLELEAEEEAKLAAAQHAAPGAAVEAAPAPGADPTVEALPFASTEGRQVPAR